MQVKEYLKNYNMTQTDFANKLGISKTHINLIINRKRNPSISLAKKMQRVTKGKISALEILGLK